MTTWDDIKSAGKTILCALGLVVLCILVIYMGIVLCNAVASSERHQNLDPVQLWLSDNEPLYNTYVNNTSYTPMEFTVIPSFLGDANRIDVVLDNNTYYNFTVNVHGNNLITRIAKNGTVIYDIYPTPTPIPTPIPGANYVVTGI